MNQASLFDESFGAFFTSLDSSKPKPEEVPAVVVSNDPNQLELSLGNSQRH